MTSPSEDPFVEDAHDDKSTEMPKLVPAKRALFKNRKARVVRSKEEEEAQEAVEFFSRSKEIFPEAVRERRERREREERRRREKERERVEEGERRVRERERRERRFVIDADGDEEGSGEEFERRARDSRRKEGTWSKSRSISPPRHRSISADSQDHTKTNDGHSYKRRSPRNDRRTRSRAEQPQAVISLSSDEDDDEDLKLATQRSSHTVAAEEDDEFGSPPRSAPPRKRSPSVEELPVEDEMFPELVAAARAQAAAEQAEKLKAMQRLMTRTKSLSSHGSATGSPRPTAVDSPIPVPSSPLLTRQVVREDAVISIYIDSRVEGLCEAIIVKRKLSQRFKDVRMAWCDRQVIQGYRGLTDVEKESVFLSWRGRRVWDVTTAESLGIRVDGRGRVVDEKGTDLGGNVHLEAWTADAFEQWQREKKAAKARVASGLAFHDGEHGDLDGEEPAAEDVNEAQQPPAQVVQKIRILLKAKGDEPVKLIVKASTKIEKIVEGYVVQRREQCGGKQVELWFDGERLQGASTVGEADVEDMSGIDVVLRDA